jgi:hypothetical protein
MDTFKARYLKQLRYYLFLASRNIWSYFTKRLTCSYTANSLPRNTVKLSGKGIVGVDQKDFSDLIISEFAIPSTHGATSLRWTQWLAHWQSKVASAHAH